MKYQMRRKDIKITIREHFFQNPTSKLRVRQIERELHLPLPSVIRYVKELVEEQILSRQSISNIVLYTANRSSKQFLLEKRSYNNRKLVESGLIEYMIRTLSNPTIIVFGSFSKGEDTKNSDIDLFIETLSSASLNLKPFEKKLDRSIQIFKNSKIHKIKNKELANNIINGITLNGFIEVYK